MRVLVEVLQIGMGRRRIEIEVVLLDVLAVVALAVRQAEEPFLEDRILAVPQRQGEAEQLPIVADPRESVLAPAIGARARVIVAEVVPRVAGLAVVFANGAPLAFAEIGPPLLPRGLSRAGLLEPCL